MFQRSGAPLPVRHRTRRLRRAGGPLAAALVLAGALPLGPAPAGAACAAGARPGARPATIAAPASAPGQPTGVSVQAGDQRVTVAWTAPDDGGSPITGYTVRAYHACDEWRTVSAAAGASSATVTGLTNGTSYQVEVFATNAIGDGPPSEAVTATPSHQPVVVNARVQTRVHVGGPAVLLPVGFTLDGPASDVVVLLQEGTNPAYGAGHEVVRGLFSNDPAPGTRFSSTLSTTPGHFAHWGPHQWLILQPPDTPTAVDVSVRLHSLLGMTARRSGDRVTVHASARAYHSVLNSYRPWRARTIEVQRWSGTRWQRVRTLTTGTDGNAVTTFTLPWTAALRLWNPDSSRIWGATSFEQVL